MEWSFQFSYMKDQAHHTATDTLVLKLRQAVENNLQNEQFGVEQLAKMMNISRSQLHRKLKKSTGQSVNQFIREYRLQRAMELLKQADRTVSEIAFEVGFGSHSYFTTCFTEHYGYPPGEVKYRTNELSALDDHGDPSKHKKPLVQWSSKLEVVALVTLGLILSFLLYKAWAESNSNYAITNKSIAVLPFKNMSGDPEQEAMCDGLTDEIIHRLSMIKSFDKVISLPSVMTFKNSNNTLPEIARLLDVDIVLQGSFKQSGDVVRITVRLIDATNDDHLWSEDYERPIGDIIEIQVHISKKIAARFNANITSEEDLRLTKTSTQNSEAYILLQKGWFKSRNAYGDGADVSAAIGFFNKALEIDPTLAEAYLGLASAYLNADDRSYVGNNSVIVMDPLFLVDKALRIDSELSSAYRILGSIKHAQEWDFTAAEQAYEKALQLDPQNSAANYIYAAFLTHMGRIREALPFAIKAVETSPTYFGYLSELIKFYFYAGERSKAMASVAEYQILFPNDKPAAMGKNYIYLEDLEKAIEILGDQPDLPVFKIYLAVAYAKNRQFNNANKLIKQLEQQAKVDDSRSINYSIGLYYASNGQVEEALNWLEKAYESHDTELYWLKTEPMLKSLHGHPRYEALLRKIGFPD